MLFNSLTYLLFMLLAVPLVVYGPNWLRRTVLLVGSLTFYAFWRIDFTFLMLFTASLDYTVARCIARSTNPTVRKALLASALTINLALLIFFKYLYFIVGSAHTVADAMGMPFNLTLPQIILPLGISFYTFQSMCYAIDVYRGTEKPVSNYLLYLSYVTFWPQLFAGPILRAHNLVPTLLDYRRPDRDAFTLGLMEILQGLFKKLVLGDTIAEVVNEGFAQPVGYLGTLDVWTLAFAFGLQVYFDFSGYSQIAIGSARIMGFSLPRNFDWPYLADSPREFWRRWHISLSSWIRDYLYLPLSGVKFSADRKARSIEPAFARATFALFMTWLIMGLWHGANWTFAIWGLWHAALVFGYRISGGVRSMVPKPLRSPLGWAVTLPLVMLGWIFFRVSNVHDGVHMLVTALNPTLLRRMGLRENLYLLTFLFFCGFLTYAAMVKLDRTERVPTFVRIAAQSALNGVMICGVFLLLKQSKSFIYFQF